MPKRLRSRGGVQPAVAFCAIAGMAFVAYRTAAAADAAEAPTSFARILESHHRESLRAVAEYLKHNPTAPDVERAYEWAFKTATGTGLETELVALADGYLKRHADGPSRALARRVLSIAWAKSGKLADAMAAFQAHMQNVDVRNPSDSLDFGVMLAEQAQLQDDLGAAREVYNSLSRGLFLNAFAREFCESRLSHLELAKQPAPAIGASDLDGRRIELGSMKGKVVLVDFWAIDCAPCLEQFPALQQLYGEYHDDGFEVVGISLDEQRELIDEFQKKWQLPWPLALSNSDRHETRHRYRAEKIPTTYLVDQKGDIAFVDLQDAQLRQAVEKLLGVRK